MVVATDAVPPDAGAGVAVSAGAAAAGSSTLELITYAKVPPEVPSA